MNHQRKAKQWLWKLYILSVALFIACTCMLEIPVYAAETWSQFVRTGPVISSNPGGFTIPKGVTVDSSGNVYVADSGNHRIQKLTLSTNTWSEWKKVGGGAGTGLGEFSGPSAVAVDSSGNVYVADSGNHRIQKLTLSTNTWSEWKKVGGGSGLGLGEFNNPRGVAVDSSGNVYVADSSNHRIQKLTLSTNTWSVWKKPSAGAVAGSGLGEFNFPNGVAVDSSGNVYVGDTFNNRIQKLTKSTNTWSEWKSSGGGAGTGLGEFNTPRGVAVDNSGNIFVADSGNHRIQKLTAANDTWSEWVKSGGGTGSDLGEFTNPNGVAVDSSGNVYVADDINRIQKLNAANHTWIQWSVLGPVNGISPGEFALPRGVAVDSSGNVYVADTSNHRIQKLTLSTNTWSEWKKVGGGAGSGLGEFSNPYGVAVDSSGNVYVADSGNHRIQKLTQSTNTWSEWGKSGGLGTSLGEFNTPMGVAVDSSGNVYVGDRNNHRIQKLTLSTNTWSEWKKVGGGAGSGLGEFTGPSAVAVDSSGNVYVADTSNHRIQKLTLSTNTWSEWKKIGGGTGTSLGEFNSPYGVAVDSSGNVYVADSSNHRIQKLTLSTNTWGEWKKVGGGTGTNLGEFSGPYGVAVDSSGNVYVADTSNHRIQKLDIPASAITDFASTAKTSTTASFSWTAASGATGIIIEQSPAGANTWTTATIGAIATSSTTATVTGLSAATAYDFRLVVTGGANAGNSNTVSVMTDYAPTYTIAEIADQTATALTAGYSSGAQDTKTITITTTGTGDLTNVATALSGTNATDFVITQPGATTLNSGTTSTTFTVKAKDGLAAGTYTATVTIYADNMTNVTFTVTQTVNPAPVAPSITSQPVNKTVTEGQTATFSVTASGDAPLSYQWKKDGNALTDGGNISGATAASLSITNAQSGDAGSYTVAVTNAAGNATSNAATLTVNPAPVAPSITSQSGNKTVTEGQTATFSVTASGDAPLSYQWKKDGNALTDGGNISGATAASLSIANAQSGDAGSYTVVVTNAAGNTTSNAATLTVNPAPVAPSITSQPGNKTVTAGQTATFSVTASGDAPLSYQWKKDGNALTDGGNISGATAASLSIANAQSGDAGSYTVVVTNAAGNATSNAATLTVNPAPVAPSITSQPGNKTVTEGQTATFSVTASGDAPLSYQWKKDGNALTDGGNISGATAATLSIANAQSGDAGSYTVVVTNAAGNASSNAATLTVNPAPVAPSITSQPVNKTVTEGQTATFSVTASGDAPLSYRWKKDGNELTDSGNISGATTASLSITNAQSGDAGSYTVVVTNAAGNASSNAATLTVNPAPVAPSITSQPVNKTVTEGQTATFSVTASGDAPFSYQWKKDGNELTDSGNISGATTASLSITNAQSGDAGSYTVVVTNAAGNASSNAATLTVNPLTNAATPGIDTQPTGATVNEGDSSPTLSVAASVSDGGMLTYQWYSNTTNSTSGGTAVSGATSSTYAAPTTTAGTTYYYVIVTNTNNSVNGTKTATTTSNIAAVAVNIAPTYTIAAITNQTLTALTQGYASGTQETKTIDVTNTGTSDLSNLSANISGIHASDFVITQPSSTLMSGATATSFTVKAKDGLPAGTYTATLTLSATHMTDVTFTVTQTVNLPNALPNPQNLVATGGDRKVTLNWNTVTGATYYNIYMATASSQFSNATVVTVTSSTYNVQNLLNGTAYFFMVKAGNSGGLSGESNQANATPATVPAAPTNVSAIYGNGEATVTFMAPTDNGGSAITGYEVTASSGNVAVTGAASPIVITGLTNGTSYTFTVKAINGIGKSAPSAESNAVIPQTPFSDSTSDSDTPSAPSTPTTPEKTNTDVDILVNGKAENAGTATTTQRNGQTITTVFVDQKKLEDKLATEGQNAVVVIPVNNKSDMVIGSLNGQMVKNMEDEQAVLEIKTDRATYTIPAQQININTISEQVGKSVALQDIEVQIEIAVPTTDMVNVVENAAAKGTFTLVAPPLNFTVRGTYGDKTIEVSKFNAYVKRTIALPDVVDPSKITTGIVVEPDGTVRHVPTKIVVIDGKYYAQINSLTNSTYSVVWHPLEFSDVANHWAKQAVGDMGSRMVIDGTGNGMFSPDRDITRAEFAAIIVRGLGLKLENGATPFSDVKSTDWYSSVVNTAYAYHLISGFEDGTFRPMDRITREQAMVVLSKAMAITSLKAKLSVQSTDAILRPYGDMAAVSAWALSSVADNVQAGIVSGRSGNELAPKDYITRAEVATIIQGILQKSGLI